MKALLAVSIFIIVHTQSFSQTINDFRGFSWGNSLAQIESNEKAKLILKDKDDALEYDDQIAGSDCIVIYTFNDNDKFISGAYVFTKNYSNPQLYVQDYNKFKQVLIQKYGKPKNDLKNWTSESSGQLDKDKIPQSVAQGLMSLSADWETDRSLIKIDLIYSNNKPSLRIHYTTKNLAELEDQEQLKQALDKL